MTRPTNDVLALRAELFPQGLYFCEVCQEIKPTEEFGKRAKARYGLRTPCRACVRSTNQKSEAKQLEESGLDEVRKKKREQQRAWRKNTRPKREEHFRRKEREAKLKNAYGITIKDFDTMLAEQDGRCAICCTVKPHSKWHVDHCHETGEVRGILCQLCNVGIGAFRDSQDALAMAQIYLRPRGMI